MPADPWMLLGALVAEQATGRPRLWRGRLAHPVTWIAGAIRGLEGALNRRGDFERWIGGILTLLIVAGGAGLAGLGLDRLFAHSVFGAVAAALVGSLGLALHSLYVHVAALESLAESFNDGVVAPLAWFLAGGLAGLFVYKAVNTADSLIGHKEAPYRHFGWAAARTDDLMNLIPARLAGGLIALAGGKGWRTMLRDAPRHASPNAGWPEAAMAGALGVRLGGPASYDGVVHDRPVFGDGPAPGAADLRRGLRLYLRACAGLVLALALGGLAWPR